MVLRLVIVIFYAFAPVVAPARAQAPTPPELDLEALARAAREAMQALNAEIAPWIEQLGVLLDDPGAYEPPVMTPEGDIVIRRRRDAPPLTTPTPEDDENSLSL